MGQSSASSAFTAIRSRPAGVGRLGKSNGPVSIIPPGPAFGGQVNIEAIAGITDGSMHHVDMTPDQMLALRPLRECSAYRTPVAGLYLCGSGAHPGGGVSGMPGHNAAAAVIEDL